MITQHWNRLNICSFTGRGWSFTTISRLYYFYQLQAQEPLILLAQQIAEQDNVTEQFKVDNQMEWVSQMNNIRNRATEIVSHDIVYN